MRRFRLLWHLYPTFLLLTLAAIATVTWHLSETLRDFHLSETEKSLGNQARLVRAQIRGDLQAGSATRIDQLSKELGRQTGTRITVILPDGKVVADSENAPATMDNHAQRPEIVTAMSGGQGVATRFSHTLQQWQMYVALPVKGRSGLLGVVRTSIPMTAIETTLDNVHQRIVLTGVIVALIFALLSLWLARRISRPMEAMRKSAARFARGQFTRRMPSSSIEEVAALAETLNSMSIQLEERFQLISRQNNEQEAVLGSMVEGVLAVDNEEKILRLNQPFATLFEIKTKKAIGRPVREVLRKVELQHFIADALAAEHPLERDISLLVGGEERRLQAHGTPLLDEEGGKLGALVVFNDVTRLRRLESLRRDFVANVSHELKTPITAIKGWAETLRDAEPDDSASRNHAAGIIARQADRLNAIINDLLALSRVELDQERLAIELRPERLRPVLDAALQACSVDSAAKRIVPVCRCDAELTLPLNAPLLEQAVVNLLSNAIKYSEPEGRVIVEAVCLNNRIMLKVQDFGCGIPREHIPRLFERFYRVDPARSRELGGTGLGLAIVKHIVQAHRGELEVHSSVGNGSTFTINLPQR